MPLPVMEQLAGAITGAGVTMSLFVMKQLLVERYIHRSTIHRVAIGRGETKECRYRGLIVKYCFSVI
jgi:hypothetical protein